MMRMSTRCTETLRELAWLIIEEDRTGTPLGISEHLLECPRCALEAQRLRALVGRLSPGPVPEPPAAYWQSFTPRLRVKLAAQGMAGRIRTTWIWAMAGTAASFLLAALAVGRWEAPPETRVRLQLEQAAQGLDPDSLQAALDTFLPETDAEVPPGNSHAMTAGAADMAQALEEVLPEYESGFNGVTREPATARELKAVQSPDPGWV